MKRRWVWRGLAGVGVLLLAFLVCVFVSGYRAFGKGAEGPRLALMQRSPEWRGDGFVNPEPLYNDYWGMLTGIFDVSPDVAPKVPVPVLTPVLSAPITTGLRVTWLGHSTTLVEIDGRRVLTDPVWNDRVSPLAWAGPLRWFAPLIPLDALEPVDAIVVSHDHYDHLDMSTVIAMKDWDTVFVVPLGVGAHLEYWGIPEQRIKELDWWQRTFVHGLEIVCVPARHASGRVLWDKDDKLWAGYALLGERHRVYYSGDTGLFPAMRHIGARFGPFDLTMIEVGQYNPAWPDWHLGPEQAVRAHGLVRGKVMLPVHWGAFGLAYHAWTEPIERVLAAGAAAGATLVAPRPGQPIEPETHPPVERWWPSLPGKTGAEDPIRATMME